MGAGVRNILFLIPFFEILSIDFFERTVMSIIDEVTPYMIYYFMLKSNFIIQWSEFTGTEMHIFSTAKDGTKTDLSVLNQIYQ